MSELLRELEEDIRAERMSRLWQRFGKSMVWVSIAVVAGTAAGVMWKEYSHSQAMQRTNLLITADMKLDAKDYPAAIAAFDTVGGSSVHAAAAQLGKARAQQAGGKKDEAEKTLESVAKNDSGDTAAFADIAKITLSANGKEQAVRPGSPFYYTASETRAWNLVGAGKQAEAADIFAALAKDDNAPAGMKQRAELALQRIAPAKLAAKDAHE